jgi:hypothetical protein
VAACQAEIEQTFAQRFGRLASLLESVAALAPSIAACAHHVLGDPGADDDLRAEAEAVARWVIGLNRALDSPGNSNTILN